MGKCLGIDLGTTYSSVSYFESNSIETIELDAANNSKLLPSVVYYPEDGSDPVVGVTAKHQKKLYPNRVVDLIKRHMGEEYRHKGTEKTPPEVSSEILKTLHREAQDYLGEEVKDAIITIPAYFGEYERAHTREAGEIAGLNVVSLLPEPHAAALAYSVENTTKIDDRHVLVYDLGGGTFDVTLIHATSQKAQATSQLEITTLVKAGDKRCGGADWDRVLFEIVASALDEKYDYDATRDPRAEALLMEKCELTKRDLSNVKSRILVGENVLHEVEVTRAAFEKAARDLVFKTQTSLELVLHKAEEEHGVTKDDIVLMLCGGSTKMPMIRDMIEKVMGTPPMTYKSPDLLVSIGAAYWTQLAGGETIKTKSGLVAVQSGGLVDIATYGIGVSLWRGSGAGDEQYIQNIIPAESEYDGTEYSVEAETRTDGQTAVSLPIYEGNSEDLDECKFLASFNLTGLPARPKGQPIDVYLAFDTDGVIKGRGVDRQTAKNVDIVINRRPLAGA